MNRTDPNVPHVHGADPQHLFPKIIRERCYESAFWKEHLLGFPLDSVYEKTEKLVYIGGCFANQRPSPFLCCALKLLQLGCRGFDERLLSSQNKYACMLGLFLFRLTHERTYEQIYLKLEPFLADRRRLKWQLSDGTFVIKHVDEYVEELLGYHLPPGEIVKVCDIVMPRIPSRAHFVRLGVLEQRSIDDTVFKEAPIADDPTEKDETQSDNQVPKTSKKKKEKWRL